MSSYSVLKASFQYGEISPFFGGQVQSEIYAAGVKEMKNVLPDQCGGFRKRNGTVFFASPDPTLKTRLLEFYTGSDSYVIAINTNKTYLYTSDTVTQLCSASTPYSTYEEIIDVKFRANKGILYLVHPSYKPKKLTITPGTPPSIAYTDLVFTPSGQFGSADDYPSAICFKGGRLFLAASNNNPTTVWASRTPADTDRYTDFTLNDNEYKPSEDTAVDGDKNYYEKKWDGDTYYFELIASPSGDPSQQDYYEWNNIRIDSSHAFELEENDMYGTKIHWLAVQNRVICGNKRAIFMDTGDISSPTTFDMTTSLNTGSSPIQAKAYKNYVLFLGTNEKQLYLMVWDDNLNNYTALEITKNASHMFKAGIADFDIMIDPEIIIWVITKDGQLFSCSQATGWASHPRAAGTYTALAVAGESHNRLFLEVKTGEKYHFEYLDVLASDTTEGIFTDCTTIFDNSGTPDNEITVNEALEGQTVKMYADGAMWADTVPEEVGGVVKATYLEPVDKGYIGLPIVSEVVLFSPEIPANGTSIGKVKSISRVTVRLYASFGGSIAADGGKDVLMLSRRFGDYEYGDPIELVSEDMSVDIMGKNTTKGGVYITHDYPVPFNVLSVGTRFEIKEV